MKNVLPFRTNFELVMCNDGISCSDDSIYISVRWINSKLITYKSPISQAQNIPIRFAPIKLLITHFFRLFSTSLLYRLYDPTETCSIALAAERNFLKFTTFVCECPSSEQTDQPTPTEVIRSGQTKANRNFSKPASLASASLCLYNTQRESSNHNGKSAHVSQKAFLRWTASPSSVREVHFLNSSVRCPPQQYCQPVVSSRSIVLVH